MIETDDFLADLERHLHEAAERRDAGVERPRLGRVAPRRRPRPVRLAPRPARPPRLPMLVRRAGLAAALLGIAALVAVIAGHRAPAPDDRAVATPTVSPEVDAAGRRIASHAATDVYRMHVCRRAPDVVPRAVDTPLSPAIARLLPGLTTGTGVDPAKLRLEPMTARGVLRSSARRVSLGSGLKLTVYVLDGLPVGGLADPPGCLGARIARARTLAAGKPPAVRESAQRQVRALRDTAPDLQTLMLQLARTGQQGWSGAGLPAWSAHAPRPGIALSGSAGKGRSAYLGIADPRATHVVVRTREPVTVPVAQGFYGFELARGTGRVMLDETAADGTVVATRAIR